MVEKRRNMTGKSCDWWLVDKENKRITKLLQLTINLEKKNPVLVKSRKEKDEKGNDYKESEAYRRCDPWENSEK